MNSEPPTSAQMRQIKLMEAVQDASLAVDTRGLRIQLLPSLEEEAMRDVLWSHCQQWYPGSFHIGPQPRAEINALTNLILIANVLRTYLDTRADTKLM